MRIVLELKLRSLVACSASCTCVGVQVWVRVFLFVCVRQRNGRFIIQDYPAGIEAPPPCSTKYSPYPNDAIDDMFASPACLPGTIIDLSLSLGLRLRLGMSREPVPETEAVVCPQFLEQLKMLSCQGTARTLRVSALRSFSYIIWLLPELVALISGVGHAHHHKYLKSAQSQARFIYWLWTQWFMNCLTCYSFVHSQSLSCLVCQWSVWLALTCYVNFPNHFLPPSEIKQLPVKSFKNLPEQRSFIRQTMGPGHCDAMVGSVSGALMELVLFLIGHPPLPFHLMLESSCKPFKTQIVIH